MPREAVFDEETPEERQQSVWNEVYRSWYPDPELETALKAVVHGNCHGKSAIFCGDNPLKRETPKMTAQRVFPAVKACAECPALRACREALSKEREVYGVMAGEFHYTPKKQGCAKQANVRIELAKLRHKEKRGLT